MLSKGNIRLWSVLSALWIVGAGWAFWPTLPLAPTSDMVDVSNFSSPRCDFLYSPPVLLSDEQIAKEAEKAVQAKVDACLENAKNAPNRGLLDSPEVRCAPSRDVRLATALKLQTENFAAENDAREKAKKAFETCRYSDAAMADMLAASASRLTQMKLETAATRKRLLMGWGAAVFIPPLVIPFVLWGGLIVFGWVSAGYRGEE